MKFYMVTSYTYDGCFYDSAPYFPASTKEKAIEYMFQQYVNQDDYRYEFRIVEDQIRMYDTQFPGQYAYWYLYIQEMTMDEEL